jgi:hypothetical membrane protein
MLLPIWYAILFGITVIGFLISLFICTRLYPPPRYSILTRTISGLGHPDHKSAKIFNPIMITMGVVLALFPYFLLQVLPVSWLTNIGIGTFFCVPAGLILVGVFPEHKESGHLVGAVLCLGGSLLANGFLIYPIFISPLSNFIIVIQIIILIVCVPLSISAAKQLPSYIPDQRIEKILYNLNLWEWSQFLALQTWIFALYLNFILAV